MAHAQYETRTETVETTVVVLELSEDEADELRRLVNDNGDSPELYRVHEALRKPEAPQPTNTYTVDGITYDLDAKYRDREDEVWEFTGRTAQNGEPYVTFMGNVDNIDTISEIEESWGPLTKVTE
ncbi:phiSA1p31-related protein [Streptomyces roseolus]|uniref:phiSA1p31-related protein n=1 Tax=Streptomyces roseolus TaxID=67358 RepID=UPI0036660A6B